MKFGVFIGQELVENVVISLGRLLKRNSRFFKQIRLDVSACDLSTRVEVNANEFAETRRVVVSRGFGITVGFQHRIRRHNLVL